MGLIPSRRVFDASIFKDDSAMLRQRSNSSYGRLGRFELLRKTWLHFAMNRTHLRKKCLPTAMTLALIVTLSGAPKAMAANAATGPCLRLSEADAGQAFGEPVKRASTDPCHFEAVGNPIDYFTLEVQPGQAENSEKLLAPLQKIFGDPDPVTGVGDRAFSFESVLVVLYKNDYFAVNIFSSRLTRQHIDLAAAKAIARRLIPLL